MKKYRITNHATKDEIIVEANSPQEAAKKVGYRIKGAEVIDIGQPKLIGMNIDEAIEIQTRYLTHPYIQGEHELVAAMNLGIEALKWRKESEQYDSSLKAFPLPGETEE